MPVIVVTVTGADEIAARLAALAGVGLGGGTEIGNTDAVPYAAPVYYGARPHVIVPRNARALYWPGARHPVRRVNHPGNAPNPYLDRGVDAALPAVIDLISADIATALDGGALDPVALWDAVGQVALPFVRAEAPVRTGRLAADIRAAPYTRG